MSLHPWRDDWARVDLACEFHLEDGSDHQLVDPGIGYLLLVMVVCSESARVVVNKAMHCVESPGMLHGLPNCYGHSAMDDGCVGCMPDAVGVAACGYMGL
jgi:hypothetical protein